ncbi:hypothetical protein HOD05_05125 [Candidatus Woesearchaeota archaeon]|jgi:hypothetical protein|nr:hypothetical protein [Candidatus Woesearchaeota archaeon]MBT4150376.1 hypothetical protein [Candidatus Woesearchaeota archaeon]MBT4247376.1 hypothetical protein [Candidatus Woesearchaeota archaeon]MBT4434569.1 hypothetical protein [Candidatus Woesearchaeota archaeon]MBT7332010.1 hypothetical protein [Candidatus Woesearchaeota archaeon]
MVINKSRIKNILATSLLTILGGGCIGPTHYAGRRCVPYFEMCEPTKTYKGTFESGDSTINFEVPDKNCHNKIYKFSIDTPAGVAWIWGNNREANVQISNNDLAMVNTTTGKFSQMYEGTIHPDESFNCFNNGQGVECRTLQGNPENASKIAGLVCKIVGEYLPAVQSEQY